MSAHSDEDFRFVLDALCFADVKWDWAGTNTRYNYARKDSVQQRFRAIVQRNGYDLENGRKVVSKSHPTPAPSTPQGQSTNATASTTRTNGDNVTSTSTTKRKRPAPTKKTAVTDEDDTPVKKPKTSSGTDPEKNKETGSKPSLMWASPEDLRGDYDEDEGEVA